MNTDKKQNTEEVKLMKGNEAIAHAAIRCGCDGYFGYPITPQSEIMETLMELEPWNTTGMVVLQAESETATSKITGQFELSRSTFTTQSQNKLHHKLSFHLLKLGQ